MTAAEPGPGLTSEITPGLTVLSVNAGSSSLKVALHAVGPAPGDEHELWRWDRDVPEPDPGVAFDALASSGMPRPDVVGHRVVHGGVAHTGPAPVDDALLADLRGLVPLAPLHEPAAIAGIEAAMAALPDVPQVACFDTAFHHTMPEEAAHLPLPERLWLDGVRRYGFHGLSYEFVVDHVGAGRLGRAVIAHLGNGASMCAVRDGRSVDTTMGFTPTGGIVMGTRSGDLDPGLLVHLLTDGGYDATSLDHLVNHEAGLLGLSGSSSDMRALLDARAAGDARADLAIRVFCRAVRKQVGAYAAVLGGLDTLVFTGGIGEHAPDVRDEICAGLEFLGPVTVLVVATDEDRMIARHAAALLRAR
ncbi:MAG: acetate/propionate family kinase [Acidimicrobiales bacterium]